MIMDLRQAEENVKISAKLLAIRSKVSKYDPNQTYGPKELVEIIKEINLISPFLELSEKGLINLIDLAFKVSLKKEEARYPRFQIYIPASHFGIEESDLLVHFEPPIALDVSTLHRISSGIPSRPYALFVWESESEGTLDAYGLIRIETFSTKLTTSSTLISLKLHYGLTLSVEEPGVLNVLLVNTSTTIIEKLTLRHGRIEYTYNPNTTPTVQPIYSDIENNIREQNKQDALSSEVSGYIRTIWSYILTLAVDFGHGGQFIILPSGTSLNKDLLQIQDAKVLQVKHTAVKPDLGTQIATLDRHSEQIRQIKPRHSYSPLGKINKSIENDFNTGFKNGFSKGLVIAEEIQNEYQALFDSARAIAKLSTADGCIVFDRGLRLLGFKGEVLVRDNPECVELNLNSEIPEQKGTFDINQFGTRHRSAARFCAKVPGGVAFVVSQDGDIRLFMHLGNGKVGVGGPFRPVPGLSPPVVHS
jgi:hypothetical protein